MVFLAGFVDAIAGGGGLISLPAYIFAGLPSINAIATNKMSSTMGTSVAVYRYARDGFVPWKLAPFCIACALGGSSVGANIALTVDDRTFKIIMLAILPVVAFYVFKNKQLDKERVPYGTGKVMAVASVVAFAIGIYDGFYGPGTGTFLILLLTQAAHLRLNQANGLTKIINFTTNITSLTVYLINGKVLILLGVLAGLFNIAGNYLGARAFEKKGAGFTRPVMIGVIVIFFIKVILEIRG